MGIVSPSSSAYLKTTTATGAAAEYYHHHHHHHHSIGNGGPSNSKYTSFKYQQQSPSKSSFQIHLPLRNPQRKHSDHHHHSLPLLLPQIKIKPKKAPTKRAPVTTTSDVLYLMDSLRLPVPTDIYVSLIKECTITRDAIRAAELHAHINRSGLRCPGLPLLNRLLLMYVSCGCVDVARHLFDEMASRDFVSWAVVIAGYVDSDECQEALYVFADMLQRKSNNHFMDFPASAWILVWVLKACVRTMNMELGKQVHGWVLKVGYATDLYLGSSLINFYGKFNCLEGANFVFDQMPCRDTVAWTAKIVSNCREEHFDEVLDIFNEMGKAGIEKNPFTFSSVIRACGRLKNGRLCGRQVHANAIKLGIESNLFVQCGFVDMYGKCGLLTDARRMFEIIGHERNDACWNAMLTGYIQHGFCIDAVKLLYKMKENGVQPQESLLNKVRIACGGNTLRDGADEAMHKTDLEFGCRKHAIIDFIEP